MKNLIQAALTNNRQRKLAISKEKNYVNDSLVDEFNISLKQFETFARNDRIVYDCNSNNLTENNTTPLKRSKSFSRRSWRKKSEKSEPKERKQSEPETYREIKDQESSNETELKKETHLRTSSENIRTSKSAIERRRSETDKSAGNGTPKLEKRILRRFSTNSRKTSETLFENKTNTNDAVDFGSCYVPNETKSWTVIQQKFATWGNRTNSPKNSTHRRNFSFSDNITEPAKKLVTNNFPTSLKKRRKSYECQKRVIIENDEINDDSLIISDEKQEENIHDVSLTREVIETCFVTDTGFSLSSNVWYFGELDIKCMKHFESSTRTFAQPIYEKYTGSLLAKIDKFGDVVYSITCHFENDVIIIDIPQEAGKYCLDFSDIDQPRFSSIKFLIAHLIEHRYLQRVTFDWLIENCCT